MVLFVYQIIAALRLGKRFGCLMLMLGCLLVESASAAELRVLASIQPLALIAEEILGDRGQVDRLLPLSASAHDYSLRASDARKLSEASLVLWIGPELETFLRRPLANRSADTNLAILELPGLHWPQEQRQSLASGEEHQHHSHEHDPHVWLDPRNAVVMALALAERLGQLQPSATEEFSLRAKAFAERMVKLDATLATRLGAVSDVGFAVYHEGYGHFVNRYGLRQMGYVTYTPERRPGARHLHQLRQSLKGNARCLFVESGYDLRLAQQLAGELELKLAVVSPMGGQQTESYDQLLTTMAEDFLDCLAQP